MGPFDVIHHRFLFCRCAALCARMRAPEVDIMSILTIIVLAITVLMMGYLVVTLLYPEKF